LIEYLIVVGVAALLVVIFLKLFRTTVAVGYADVVARAAGIAVYSTDSAVTLSGKSNAVYYRIPAWVPHYGTLVRRVPLGIIEIPIRNFKTFALGNPRFVVEVSTYCRVHNVLESAQKVPLYSGDFVRDFTVGFQEIILSAVRKTTANFTVEDVIAKRAEIAEMIGKEIKIDLEEWGFRLTNVAVIDIRDPIRVKADGKTPVIDQNGEPQLETTVILDISRKKEADINAISRREVANKKRDAEIAEAESYQAAQMRRTEADEAVGKRVQEKDENVAIEQKKAVDQQMNVKRAVEVTTAEIGATALVKKTEGEKSSQILLYEADMKKKALEGEGEAMAIELKGAAQGKATLAIKTAEAEGLSKIADAQRKQEEYAKAIRAIEKDEKIGLALADALGKAKIQAILSGEPKSLLELFSQKGGMNLGGMLTTLKAVDPDTYERGMTILSDIVNGKKTVTEALKEPGVKEFLAKVQKQNEEWKS
jgi:hypothetical protein